MQNLVAHNAMSVLGILVFVIFAFDLLDMIHVWFGGWLRECIGVVCTHRAVSSAYL